MGAAIVLLPTRAAEAPINNGLLPDNIRERGRDPQHHGVAVQRRGALHVRLDAVQAPGDPIPADVAQWILTFVRRCDLGTDVSGYGSGQFSLLVT